MKKRMLFLVLAAFSLTGCANKVWHKSGASTQEFYSDKAECSAMSGSGNHQINTPQMNSGGGFNDGFQQGWNNAAAIGAAGRQGRIFSDCMAGRGWSLQDERSAAIESLRDIYAHERKIAASSEPEIDPQIKKGVELLMGDPFEQLSPKDKFWRDLGNLVPAYREINKDKRFHYWLSVTDSTTGKERQQLLVEAQKRHDADTVAAMINQFLKTL